jgi:hypothetical protein
LLGLLNDSFDIYTVQGTFPSALPYKRSGTEDGQWVRMEGDEESDLTAALRLSLTDTTSIGISEKVPETEETPLSDSRYKTTTTATGSKIQYIC